MERSEHDGGVFCDMAYPSDLALLGHLPTPVAQRGEVSGRMPGNG